MTYLELFYVFFKIGLFTFGGGYAMLPMIQEETLARGWVQEPELLNFIAVSESTPGPFALNISTYIGMTQGGILGALSATAGVVMPSFLIILILSKCYLAFQKNPYVKRILKGLRPTVIGLLTATVLSVSQKTLFAGGWVLDLRAILCIVIAACVFFALQKKAHPLIPLLSSAVIGIGLGLAGLL